ncbi:MAG: DUF429 domain-containing protein [Alkalispirochaeta sp.]
MTQGAPDARGVDHRFPGADGGEGTVLIIGWDAAVDPGNTALSLVKCAGIGSGSPPTLWVEAHVVPRDDEELVATVSDWSYGDTPTLLCVDSPLGWPERLAAVLAEHVAGAGVPSTANGLFRRMTDIDVRRRVGKTPLDVGADRIARTALATLNAIEAVRGRGARSITMAGDIRDPRRHRHQILLLETYPAGWFASEEITVRGYRPSAAREQRRALLEEIERRLKTSGVSMSYGVDRDSLVRRADDLDALV